MLNHRAGLLHDFQDVHVPHGTVKLDISEEISDFSGHKC